jgi:hypothetical protein
VGVDVGVADRACVGADLDQAGQPRAGALAVGQGAAVVGAPVEDQHLDIGDEHLAGHAAASEASARQRM